MSVSDTSLDYIDSKDYKKWEKKVCDLNDISFDLTAKNLASRKLRFSEIDIEAERKAGKLAPDEIYVAVHVIDTNIRREQSSYIEFLAKSPRAVILTDKLDYSVDLSMLEKDYTEKLRYDGWQLSAYADVDGMQANGYGIMETVFDQSMPGHIRREYVQYGDFAFIADSRDIQKLEMTGRFYYFTKTRLKELSEMEGPDAWSKEQVEKIINAQPNDEQAQVYSGTTTENKSLYKIMKVMFRVKGIVQVAWCCPRLCDGWLRAPRPLYMGRRKIRTQDFQAPITALQRGVNPQTVIQMFPNFTEKHLDQVENGLPPSDEEYETMYPYFLYPYQISENDTIANLKGRVFLDQDSQNAASSLLSSLLTKSFRSAGLYFAKDTSDPNDDFLLQKNIYFKQGAIINGKIKEFELNPPDAASFSALNLLMSINQQETSQINFAETNRQSDSRKTATAIKAAYQQQQQLSGVQVTLFSVSLRGQYTYECELIRSRVLAGLIKVKKELLPLYQRTFDVKPSGDVDVIEKQQMIQAMMSAWPVIQQTPAAELFLSDLLEKMFPDNAAKYINSFQQAKQQQNTAQQQKLQQMTTLANSVGQSIVRLSEHPEMMSETGRLHAFPIIQSAAEKYKELVAMEQQK